MIDEPTHDDLVTRGHQSLACILSFFSSRRGVVLFLEVGDWRGSSCIKHAHELEGEDEL